MAWPIYPGPVTELGTWQYVNHMEIALIGVSYASHQEKEAGTDLEEREDEMVKKQKMGGSLTLDLSAEAGTSPAGNHESPLLESSRIGDGLDSWEASPSSEALSSLPPDTSCFYQKPR